MAGGGLAVRLWVAGESDSLLAVPVAAGIGAKPTNGRLPAGPKRSGVADSPARRG